MTNNSLSSKLLSTGETASYELIDSGDGLRFERFGNTRLIRPDPEILWPKRLSKETWNTADATFTRIGERGTWNSTKPLPESWPLSYDSLTFSIRPTSFKHTGIFPEQLPHWQWIDNLVKNSGRPISVLNLFAYTGGATLAALRAGASVCHVDGSKKAVEWAKENSRLSKLDDKPVRWIVDDVITFITKEQKRGHFYDAIILDPPSFGHGPKDELWKIERDFSKLLSICESILSTTPLFVLINGYASGYSPLTLANCLQEITKKYSGSIEYGENTILESGKDGRLLPSGVYTRWQSTSK